MVPLKELLEKFSDHPKIIENTECIIAECNFEFEFKTPKTKHTIQTVEKMMQLLTRLANEGL
jgi:DNA polymerase-3 subunit alpha/error-prone DNA polymerase